MSQSVLSYESIDELSGNVDLNLSAMTFYPYPFLPLLDTYCSFLPTLSEETGDHKRLKRSTNVSESIGSNFSLYNYEENAEKDNRISRNNSTNSISSLPQLRFRDHIRTYKQRYLAAEAVEEALIKSEEGENEERENGDGMKLVQLLISCAEAVACRDKSHASMLLSELRSRALVFGSSFQRVASCFVQGLEDRLSSVQPLGAVGYVSPKTDEFDIFSDKKDEASRLVYEICPHVRFAHFIANSAILEAFEGESYVHVVDLGTALCLPRGEQWRDLIGGLATRTGSPPRLLRITVTGVCADRHRPVGDDLEAYARGLGINFEFSVVESNLESFKIEDIKKRENEVLVVNSMLQLHCVVKESRGALNSVLKKINQLKPKILVLVEQDSSHNGPFFLGRFMEALHYYSAIFDSLDAMMPKYDTRRAKIEQFYFALEIKNIISCEGPARVERHERVDQWRRRMSRAGFQCGPIKMLAQAKQWLGKMEICDGYTVVEEKGCLVMGWKSKPIVAVSCWKC